MKHKILFISSWYPNKLEPTNGNFVQRHAEAAAIHNKVEVLHAIGDFNQKEKYIVNDQLINNLRTLIVYYNNSGNSFTNFYRRMSAFKKGFNLLNKPDLIHANVHHNSMLFAVYLKKKYRIPFVITEHWTALQSEAFDNTSSRFKRIAKFIGNHASVVLPVSKNLQSGLEKIGIASTMEVISNVVDTSVFKIIEKKNKTFNFLHISTLIDRKKPLEIIKTAVKLHEKYPYFTLSIGGDGDLQPLTALISELKATSFIQTFASLTYAEVAHKMQQSNCFILFSENETQGCVILESYACGKPVIATKVGGVPEFVNSRQGILIEKNNSEELYLAMGKMLNKEITFDTPENLRSYVLNEFSKEIIGNKFTETYNSVLDR